MVKWLGILFILLFTPITSASEMVSDWRLNKPFIHGFASSITMGYVDPFPEQWRVAEPHDHSSVPKATVPYIEQHKKIPFYLGFTLGVAFWMFTLTGACLRFSHFWKMRSV